MEGGEIPAADLDHVAQAVRRSIEGIAAIVSRQQLLELVAVLTKPKPKSNPRGGP